MTSNAAQDEFNELMRDKGRSTQHPEDRLQAQNDSDRDSDREDNDGIDDYAEKEDPEDQVDQPRDMRSNYYLPSIRSEANTGPKGVIADAHAFEQARKQANRFTWRKQSPVSNGYSVSVSASASHWNDEKGDSGSEEDEADEGFMAKWREARLRELQNAGQRIRSRTTSPSRRIYGTLTAVDGEGYLEAIEKVGRDTVVVVFIYDDLSEISQLVESCMRLVARRNDAVRFVKLHCEDAEMEAAGVPAVLAYRGAEKFAGLVPLMDEVPEDSELSALALETVFRR